MININLYSVIYKSPFDITGEKSILDLPAEPDKVYLFQSHEASKFAVIYKDINGWFVNVNGMNYGPYEVALPVFFSPDGQKYFFWGQKTKKWYLNASGIEKEYSVMSAAQPVISENSKSYGFIGYDISKEMGSLMPGEEQTGSVLPYFVVVNGKTAGEFETAEGLELSEDGNEYAFIKKVTVKKKEEVLPAKKEEPAEEKETQKSKNSASYMQERLKKLQANLNKLDEEKNKPEEPAVIETYLSINGKEMGPVDNVVFLKSVNNEWVLVAKKGKYQLYRGNMDAGFVKTPLQVADGEQLAQFAISEDGSKYGYLTSKEDGQATVYIGNTPVGTYEGAAALKFTPSGKRYSYIAREKKLYTVYIDGKQINDGKGLKLFDMVAAPGVIFSKDESRYAVMVKGFGRWYAVVDGKKSDEFKEEKAVGLEFSADGSRYGFITFTPSKKKDNPDVIHKIVVDGKVVCVSTGVVKGDMMFSPDNSQLVFGKKAVEFDKDGMKSTIFSLMNGDKELPSKWQSMSPVVFSQEGPRFSVLAYKSKKIFRIVEEILNNK